MRDLVTGILGEFSERAQVYTARVYDVQCALQALKCEGQREYNHSYRDSPRGRFMRAGQRARAQLPGGLLPGINDAPMSAAQWLERRAELDALASRMIRVHRRAVAEGEQLALLGSKA